MLKSNLSNKNHSILKGAFILGVGTFVAKLLGAIYRIPLTNLLDSTGLGLYQMIFPIYVLLLDFSGAGAPNAISKIISSFNGKDEESGLAFFKSCLIVLGFLGGVLSVFMAVFSLPLSRAQGNENAFLGYITLSPAIFFVSLISVYRGYFQAYLNMKPTCFSQIIEQVAKLVFGILFVYFLRSDIRFAVAGATLAVTLSEIVAFIQLKLTFNKKYGKARLSNCKLKRQYLIQNLKLLIKTAIPITLVSIIIPLSQTVDSIVVINILNKYRQDGTALYGLLTGATATIIGLPVAICYGVSTTAIPLISKGEKNDKIRQAKKALIITFVLSVVSALGCLLFSEKVVRLIFGGLSEADKNTVINLLHLTVVNIIFLSMLQTENSILIANGKLYLPLFGMLISIGIKVLLEFLLVKNPLFNIYGVGVSLIACYFLSSLVNLTMIFAVKVRNERKEYKNRQYAYQK